MANTKCLACSFGKFFTTRVARACETRGPALPCRPARSPS